MAAAKSLVEKSPLPSHSYLSNTVEMQAKTKSSRLPYMYSLLLFLLETVSSHLDLTWEDEMAVEPPTY